MWLGPIKNSASDCDIHTLHHNTSSKTSLAVLNNINTSINYALRLLQSDRYLNWVVRWLC